MIRSLRFRLALLSALLSGLTLIAFGVGAWWQIRRVRIARLENDVRAYAERESSRRRDASEWQRTEFNVASEIGVQHGNQILFLVQDNDRTVYQSNHWPAEFDANSLAWPQPTSGSPNGNRTPPPRPKDERADTPKRDAEQPPPPRDSEAPGPQPVSLPSSLVIGGHRWLVGLAMAGSSRVAVALDEEVIDSEMAGVRNAFLVAVPLALFLIGVGAWIFSAKGLQPIRELTATARQVTAKGLDQRISVEGIDREFAELIFVFNGMLERLERSFKQAYRFSADAAHELKTPLAILQGQLEHAIQAADDGSARQAELTSILDEVRRLSTISRKLLLLSQADAGALNLHRESVNLSKVVEDLVEDTRMLAGDLDVRSEIQPGVVAPADEALVKQVLHNLISNAIKYNVQGGWIEIAVRATPKQAQVTVANSSRGIAMAESEKVFERFYRADAARNGRIEGVGLGLSVSREIARAHGGDITLQAAKDGAVQLTFALPVGAS